MPEVFPFKFRSHVTDKVIYLLIPRMQLISKAEFNGNLLSPTSKGLVYFSRCVISKSFLSCLQQFKDTRSLSRYTALLLGLQHISCPDFPNSWRKIPPQPASPDCVWSCSDFPNSWRKIPPSASHFPSRIWEALIVSDPVQSGRICTKLGTADSVIYWSQ